MDDKKLGMGFIPSPKKPEVPVPSPTFIVNVFVRIDVQTILLAVMLVLIIVAASRVVPKMLA
jgi:hypothetical protein